MHSAGGKHEQTLSKHYQACPALQDTKNRGFSGQMLLNFINSLRVSLVFALWKPQISQTLINRQLHLKKPNKSSQESQNELSKAESKGLK